MKLINLLLSWLLLSSINTIAQNSIEKTDDLDRISLAIVMPKEETTPTSATKLLKNKLQQIAVRNGLSSDDGTPNFILTPVVNVYSKDMTPTIPPNILIDMEISLYIVDYSNKQIFSEITIHKKGLGTNETRAFIDAFRSIETKSSKFHTFVKQGKEGIIAYYNSNCDFIIKDAQTYVATQQHEKALNILMNVPRVCKECYWSAMKLVPTIFKAYQKDNVGVNISRANSAWATHDFRTAAQYLSLISSDMPDYAKAQRLIQNIEVSLSQQEKLEWQYILQRQQNEYSLSKERIQLNQDSKQEIMDFYKELLRNMTLNNRGGRVEYDLKFLK